MRKPLAIGATTLALVLSFGLVACGSDDSGSSNEDVLTNAELIQQADAICTDYNAQLTQKIEGLDESSSQEDVNNFVTDEMVPLYEKEIDELRALQPDPEDEAAYTEMIDTLESELRDVEEDPSQVTGGGTAFPEATKMAKDFGLKVCGSGGTS